MLSQAQSHYQFPENYQLPKLYYIIQSISVIPEIYCDIMTLGSISSMHDNLQSGIQIHYISQLVGCSCGNVTEF